MVPNLVNKAWPCAADMKPGGKLLQFVYIFVSNYLAHYKNNREKPPCASGNAVFSGN